MIPSRWLNLGEILGESILIAWRTWWRAALVMLVLLPIPAYLLYAGFSGFVDDVHDTLQEQELLAPENVEQFRVDFLKGVKKVNPLVYQLYLSEAPVDVRDIDVPLAGIDSLDGDGDTSSSLSTGDSLDRVNDTSSLLAATDSLPSEVATNENISDENISISDFFFENIEVFYSSFWLIGIGYLMFVILSVAGSTIIIDLACRSFEQRRLNVSAAIRDTFSQNLWANMIQYLILIFVVMFGLGITITIATFLPNILTGLVLIAALGLVIYSVVRSLFAPVAIVSEGLGPVKALQRSWALTDRSFWRIVGISIVVLLCFVVFTVIGTLPIGAIFSGGQRELIDFVIGNSTDIESFFGFLDLFIANYVANMYVTSALFASLTPAFLTVFYYDLRTRKDGPLEYGEDEVVVDPS